MKLIIILILIVLVALSAGCGPKQEVPLTDFNKVDIRHGFHVDISVGEEYNVVLEVADNVLEHVEAIKQGDTLIIRTKLGIPRDASLKAKVAMPMLTGLTVQNGSHVTASGSSGDVTFNITGGSHANLGAFAVEDADLTVSGGSHVTVNVSGRLDVKVSGGSHVTYKGDPALGDVDVSGGSTFSK